MIFLRAFRASSVLLKSLKLLTLAASMYEVSHAAPCINECSRIRAAKIWTHSKRTQNNKFPCLPGRKTPFLLPLLVEQIVPLILAMPCMSNLSILSSMLSILAIMGCSNTLFTFNGRLLGTSYCRFHFGS
jgi:hypothetical protein